MTFRVLGITLAKAHSNGVSNKNLREIAGKPLLQWTLDEISRRGYKMFDYVISSESDEVAELCDKHITGFVRRPKELAQDDTPSLDAIHHVVDYMEGRHGITEKYHAIALIPCTTPLRSVEDVDRAIQMLEDNPIADSVIGVTECIPIERVKKIVDGLIVDTYPEPQDGQRQNLEKCYTRSGIYVVRRDSLDRLFGHKTSLAYVLPRERGVNIDDPVDWTLAEALLKEREGVS